MCNQHGEDCQTDGIALPVHDDPEKIRVGGMIEALLIPPEASGPKEEVTEGAFITVGTIENSFVRNLVNSIRKRRAQGGTVVKQLAEKPKEKLKGLDWLHKLDQVLPVYFMC